MIVDLSDKRLFTNSFFKIDKALKEKTRFKIVYGGSGSSKSYSYYQHYVVKLLQETNHDFLILRKFATTLEQSVFNGIKLIIDNWGLTDYFHFTKRPYEIRNKITGRRIIFLGVDDPEKLKSIVNIGQALLEEATDFTFNDFKEVNRRLRGIEGIEIGLCFNPISHTHWIKKHFFDNPEVRKNTTITKCFYSDNQYLTEEDIEQLEQLIHIDENDYRVYVLGEWGVLTERLIFKNWKVVDDIPKEAKRLPSGMDFGFASDPTTLIDAYLLGDDIYFRELLYETGLTNLETDNPNQSSIQQRLKEINFNNPNYIIADSAEPKSIAELRSSNFDVYGVKKYPGSINDGIKLLKAYNIHITSDSPNLINEFENYVLKIDKDGNILPHPVDAYNHGIDACRYIILMKDRLW